MDLQNHNATHQCVLTMLPFIHANVAARQRHKDLIGQIQNIHNGAAVLDLDFRILDANVVGAIVDVHVTVFHAQPHRGLLLADGVLLVDDSGAVRCRTHRQNGVIHCRWHPSRVRLVARDVRIEMVRVDRCGRCSLSRCFGRRRLRLVRPVATLRHRFHAQNARIANTVAARHGRLRRQTEHAHLTHVTVTVADPHVFRWAATTSCCCSAVAVGVAAVAVGAVAAQQRRSGARELEAGARLAYGNGDEEFGRGRTFEGSS